MMYYSIFGINLLDASLNLLALKQKKKLPRCEVVNGNVVDGSALRGAVRSLVFNDAAVAAL